jgi:hypothetical protein
MTIKTPRKASLGFVSQNRTATVDGAEIRTDEELVAGLCVAPVANSALYRTVWERFGHVKIGAAGNIACFGHLAVSLPLLRCL